MEETYNRNRLETPKAARNQNIASGRNTCREMTDSITFSCLLVRVGERLRRTIFNHGQMFTNSLVLKANREIETSFLKYILKGYVLLDGDGNN